MANMSDATGILTITAVDAEMCKLLARRIDHEFGPQKSEYYTNLAMDEMGIPKDTEIVEYSNYAVAYQFTGCGRWTYENNISSMMPVLELSDSFCHFLNLDWKMEFTYTDIEIGCGVFYEQTDVLRHQKHQTLSSVQVETTESTTYNICPATLKDIADWDNQTIYDYLDFIDRGQDYDWLNEMINGCIEWYCRKYNINPDQAVNLTFKEFPFLKGK